MIQIGADNFIARRKPATDRLRQHIDIHAGADANHNLVRFSTDHFSHQALALYNFSSTLSGGIIVGRRLNKVFGHIGLHARQHAVGHQCTTGIIKKRPLPCQSRKMRARKINIKLHAVGCHYTASR